MIHRTGKRAKHNTKPYSADIQATPESMHDDVEKEEVITITALLQGRVIHQR